MRAKRCCSIGLRPFFVDFSFHSVNFAPCSHSTRFLPELRHLQVFISQRRHIQYGNLVHGVCETRHCVSKWGHDFRPCSLFAFNWKTGHAMVGKHASMTWSVLWQDANELHLAKTVFDRNIIVTHSIDIIQYDIESCRKLAIKNCQGKRNTCSLLGSITCDTTFSLFMMCALPNAKLHQGYRNLHQLRSFFPSIPWAACTATATAKAPREGHIQSTSHGTKSFPNMFPTHVPFPFPYPSPSHPFPVPCLTLKCPLHVPKTAVAGQKRRLSKSWAQRQPFERGTVEDTHSNENTDRHLHTYTSAHTDTSTYTSTLVNVSCSIWVHC